MTLGCDIWRLRKCWEVRAFTGPGLRRVFAECSLWASWLSPGRERAAGGGWEGRRVESVVWESEGRVLEG